jgi:hypothetical protein
VDDWVACVEEHAAPHPWSCYRSFDLERPHHADAVPDDTQLVLDLPCEGTEREHQASVRPSMMRLLVVAATSMIARH